MTGWLTGWMTALPGPPRRGENVRALPGRAMAAGRFPGSLYHPLDENARAGDFRR